MITKSELDELVNKYENTDFIKNDPVQFVHVCKDKRAAEIYGFIASSFAFGNRKAFIKSLNCIFNLCGCDLYNYVINGDFDNLKGCYYRIYKDFDIIALFKVLHSIYTKEGGLEELFKGSFQKDRGSDYDRYLASVTNIIYKYAPKEAGLGFKHMIPMAKNGGAMKKMNMFLRWMVRKSPVDIGIWDFMKPSELLIPLDVHVARISREMGLLERKSNDFKSVVKLTEKLKRFCPEDPVKYDFAMFAYGIEHPKINEKMF